MKAVVRLLPAVLLLCGASGSNAQIAVNPWYGADFGQQQVFVESAPQTVAVGNTGNQAVTVDSIVIANPDFRRVGGSCGAGPFTLAPQSDCTLEFTFLPFVTGDHSDVAILQTAGAEVGLIRLSGVGVRGQLSVEPSLLSFPRTAVGSISDEAVVELRSVGDGMLQVTSITPAGVPFALVGGSCGGPPITLQPQQSCTLAYTFSPLQVGVAEQDLSIDTTLPASPWSLILRGEAEQGAQTIHFPAQAARTYSPGGSFPVDPPATVNSGLAVVYGSTTPAACTVAGSTVDIVAAGSCTLTADQSGNASWAAAAQQTQSFTIARASQTLAFPAQATSSHGFIAGSTFPIAPLATSATPNAGQPILYSSLDSSVCSVSGTTVTMVGPGTCGLAADQAGDGNYHPAAQVTVQVQLVKGAAADLWVEKTSNLAQARVGDTVAYTIDVGNHGPADAGNVDVLDLPPERLGKVVWACIEATGTTCPDPSSDDGGIDVSIDFPAGASARFQLLGTVLPEAAPEGDVKPIANTASIYLQAGSPLTDPDSSNNESTATVSVVADTTFADGFEETPQP